MWKKKWQKSKAVSANRKKTGLDTDLSEPKDWYWIGWPQKYNQTYVIMISTRTQNWQEYQCTFQIININPPPLKNKVQELAQIKV